MPIVKRRILFYYLNLPRWDGKELLKAIKSDRNLAYIPIVVLTTSVAEKDVLESYSLHANCYLNKPVDFDQFFSVIQKIEDFWLNTAILPTKNEVGKKTIRNSP